MCPIMTEQQVRAVQLKATRSRPDTKPPIVLVTGSSGLVGTRIVEALQRRFVTRGIDLRAGPSTDVVGDFREPRVMRKALVGSWAVIHVAALHAPHVGVVADGEFWDVNVEATRALVTEAAGAGVQRFVYTSSTSVYGHALVPSGEEAVWVDERLKPIPRDIYDETKLTAERIITSSTIPSVVLRIARCFPEPPELTAIHRLYRGVDAQDVAEAHVLALEHLDVAGTFNVAGPLLFGAADTARLWADPTSLIRERLPKVAATFDHRGWQLPHRIDRVYDSRLAGQQLGYRPLRGVLDVANATGV